MGRHTAAEMQALAASDLDALADFLADKPYLMGDEPCGADAAVFPMVAHGLCPFFENGLRTYAEGKPNLVAYSNRLMAQYFPAFASE
jgi:glutathione S-transferase